MNKSMLLITSTWGSKKTFRLIPATNESPYNEGIYDPEVGVLALIGKEKKETFQMVPKMNQLGDPEVLKIGKRPNGKDFAEERKAVDTYYEYYIESKEEIISFLKDFATNAEWFDYAQYMTELVEEQPTSTLVTV